MAVADVVGEAVADGLPCAAAAPAQAAPGGKSAENVARLFNRTVPTALESARRVAWLVGDRSRTVPGIAVSDAVGGTKVDLQRRHRG